MLTTIPLSIEYDHFHPSKYNQQLTSSIMKRELSMTTIRLMCLRLDCQNTSSNESNSLLLVYQLCVPLSLIYPQEVYHD